MQHSVQRSRRLLVPMPTTDASQDSLSSAVEIRKGTKAPGKRDRGYQSAFLIELVSPVTDVGATEPCRGGIPMLS